MSSRLVDRVINLANDGMSIRSICTITRISHVRVKRIISAARESAVAERKVAIYYTSDGHPVSLPRISLQQGWPR